MATADIEVRVRHAPWPPLFVGLGFAVGLAMCFVVFPAQSLVDRKFDPYYFGEMGKSLARGQGLLPFGNLIKRRAPLYPLVIGGVYALFGENPRLIQVLQCLLFGCTCALTYDLGRRLFNRRTGIVAGLAVAFHPLILRYVPDLHLETLFTFLATLAVWQAVRFYGRPTLGNGALAGAAAALASLTKAVLLLYPGLFAAGLLLRSLRARQRKQAVPVPWAALVALFVTMGLVISPWTLRNYRTTGHLVPISSGMSDAFIRGFIFSKADYALLRRPPYTDAEDEFNALARRLCAEQGAVWEQDDYQTDRILNRAAKEMLFAAPGLFVRKFFVGLATFWYELTSLPNSLLAGALALVAWVFALVGWRKAHQEGRPVWLVLLPVLYMNVLLAALLALGRYSAPVLPELLVVSGYGVDALIERRNRLRG